MGIEVGGVDAGVGTSAADDVEGLVEDERQGVLQHALYGREAGLHLPTVVGGAVIGQMEEEATH